MRISQLFTVAVLATSSMVWAGPEDKLAGNEVFDKPAKQMDFFKLKFLEKSDTVFIPFVEVKLQNWGTQGAVAQTRGFGSSAATQTAQARSTLSVAVEPKLAQELATQLHQDLVEQMRAAGWKVLTTEDVKDTKEYAKLKWETDGELGKGIKIEKKDGKVLGVGAAGGAGAGYIIAVPEGQQFLKYGITGPTWEMRKILKDANANLLIPSYTINTLYFSTEETSRSTRASASVDSGPLVSLDNAITNYLNPKWAGGSIMLASDGRWKNTGVAGGKVVDSKDVSPTAANALGAAFRALGGAGIQASKSEQLVESDPVELKAEALKLGRAYNDIVARATALYKGK